MKRLILLSAACLLAAPAFAKPQGEPGPHHPVTLEQARERAKERLEKLEKMTPEQWEEHQKQRTERREKWKNMSPEQRNEMREKMMEHRGGPGDHED